LLVDAGGEFTEGHICPTVANDLALAYVPGFALYREDLRRQTLNLLTRFRHSHVPVCLDACSVRGLAKFGGDRFKELCRREFPEYLLMNAEEANTLDALADPGTLARSAVIVHCGPSPTKIASDDRISEVPVPPRHAEPMDVTGAGDAFAAGFLASSVTGSSPIDAVKRAHEIAALAISTHGSQPID
jgi:sugar/nucleoside kinase (ribokinase family)